MKTDKQLTKAETQVMNILWSLPGEQGYAVDIMACYEEPKPAMTTLLTFLKILKDKGFVQSVKIGKSQLFSPLVSKREYTSRFLRDVKNTFFGGSFTSLVSFFAQEEHISEEEMQEIMQMMKRKEI